MSTPTSYDIDLTVRYGNQELIDVPGIVATTKPWANRTLAKVNDSLVRLGIIEGDFHWHKHDEEDEFFFVVEGRLLMDLEGETVELGPQQGITIGKGVMHRPRAPQKTVILMVETSTVTPTGD